MLLGHVSAHPLASDFFQFHRSTRPETTAGSSFIWINGTGNIKQLGEKKKEKHILFRSVSPYHLGDSKLEKVSAGFSRLHVWTPPTCRGIFMMARP